jgi:hypothetical protein
MKSILSTAVVALLAISASAQANTTASNTTVTNSTISNTTVTNTTTPVANSSNASNATNGTSTGVVGNNGTIVDNNGTNDTNGTDNSTTIIDNNNSTDNGTSISIIDPTSLVPCNSGNQTQCAFVFGTEFCCILASGNEIGNSGQAFTSEFCYNQTLLNEQKQNPVQYGGQATLNTLACLGGNILNFAGAAIAVGAATLLF